MKLRLLIASLNLIAIKAHGPGMGPGPCDRRGVKTGADGNCVDINECETEEHDCPSDQVCFNLDATKSSGYFDYGYFDCKPARLQTTSGSTTETTPQDDYSAMKTTANTTTANTTAANTTTANTTTKSIHNETETISQAKTTAQVETTTKGLSTTQAQMTTNAGITTKITVEIVALIVAVFLFY